MRCTLLSRTMVVTYCAALALSTCHRTVAAQQVYHNIVNQRFRTVGNGPQSALIVDVPTNADAAAVSTAVSSSYQAMRKSRDTVVARELAVMRRNGEVKPGRQVDFMDTAIIRRGGKLATRAAGITRSPGSLTFSFPTDGSANAWSTAKGQQLTTLANGLVTELTNVLGAPAWSGTVKVLNKDPYLGTVNEILGSLFVLDPASNSYQIWFPSFSDSQTEFLAMAQVMAQAWHGPDMIGYDPWEKGMARTAAVIAAQDMQTYPGVGTAIDPANGFYYTPDYDILNQPALGNSTFTPPTKGAQTGPTVNPTQFGGMIIPRLQMSGSAWLKCYIENPSFFINFNQAYYAAFALDNTIANDVNRLRALAATAVPSVEGQPFDTWFEQQYVLDTSVTVGAKLYTHTSATFPDATSPAGAAVYLIYYETTSTGDELDLNGTSQVVYWDYTFTNRLNLPSFGTVNIADGFGTVAPYFQGIGGNPADQMRLAMDFPVNKDYARVYFPTGQTGTAAAPSTFSGVVTGQDSGTLAVSFTSGGSFNTINATVAQGAFSGTGTVGTGFSRTKLVLTQTGVPTVTVYRNLFIRGGDIAPIFSIAALGSTTTVNHSFLNGVQMVSMPIRPLTTDLAVVMGADPSRALIAQFRQDNSIGSDQYLRYPTIPAYQPGYGLWTNFPSVTTNSSGIIGNPSDPVSSPNVSIGIQFGWNQIGPPYNTTMNVTADIQFQYLGGTPASYADAVTNGWIAAGVIGYTPLTGYEDITNPTDPTTFPTNQLSPWQAYWIRVTVPEGVTMTFLSPASRAARVQRGVRATQKPAPGSWRLSMQLSDPTGLYSSATIGQMSGASDAFKSTLDISGPPPAPGGSPLTLRLPAKQGDQVNKGAPGDLMADYRALTAGLVEWDVVANLSGGAKTYTLTWSNTALLPKGTRLTVTDKTSGSQCLMNSTSAYTFRAAAGETSRVFHVVATPRSVGRLRVSNVWAQLPPAGRGAGPANMTISYELSAVGQVGAVISLNGRVIRHVSQSGRAAQAGINQLVWDLRDDNGRSVGTGTYMLQISALGDNGEQTRSITPITVVR